MTCLWWPFSLTLLNTDSVPSRHMLYPQPDCLVSFESPTCGKHTVNLSWCWWTLNMMLIGFLNYHQMQDPQMSLHLMENFRLWSASSHMWHSFFLPHHLPILMLQWAAHSLLAIITPTLQVIWKEPTLLEKAEADVMGLWALKDNGQLIYPKVEYTKKYYYIFQKRWFILNIPNTSLTRIVIKLGWSMEAYPSLEIRNHQSWEEIHIYPHPHTAIFLLWRKCVCVLLSEAGYSPGALDPPLNLTLGTWFHQWYPYSFFLKIEFTFF